MESKDEMGIRHIREFVEFRARQKAEVDVWDSENDPGWIPKTPLGRAEQFLRVYLKDGGRGCREIEGAAKTLGITLEKLRKAKASLVIESYKVSWLWYWRFKSDIQV